MLCLKGRENAHSHILTLNAFQDNTSAFVNKQLVQTSHYLKDTKTTVLFYWSFHVRKDKERSQHRNHEKWKTKFWDWVQTSWNWTHNSCSLSPAQKRKLSGSHGCCEMRHESCKVFFLYPSEQEKNTRLTNNQSIMFHWEHKYILVRCENDPLSSQRDCSVHRWQRSLLVCIRRTTFIYLTWKTDNAGNQGPVAKT